MTHTPDIRSIIQRGGGPKRLHAHAKELEGRGRLDQAPAEKSIYSWFEIGIPEKHWGWVMPACEVSESDLHRANEMLRKRRAKEAA